MNKIYIAIWLCHKVSDEFILGENSKRKIEVIKFDLWIFRPRLAGPVWLETEFSSTLLCSKKKTFWLQTKLEFNVEKETLGKAKQRFPRSSVEGSINEEKLSGAGLHTTEGNWLKAFSLNLFSVSRKGLDINLNTISFLHKLK